MRDDPTSEVEVGDVAPGLWLWRQRHWEWREGDDWEPEVSSWVVESGAETLLLDPLAPPPSARQVYDRLEARRPTGVVILKPDYVRDVDLFVHWFDIPAFGPWLFWQGDVPRTKLTAVRPDDELPGGLRALSDGRESMETPLYLPEQRAVVFADAMTAPDAAGGVLGCGRRPSSRRAPCGALALLDLPFQHVLVSHGQPVHTRADFEAALERDPWSKIETP